MEQAASSSRVLRFGVFEVDLRSGELRKQGLKIRLQEQPLQVLALLLEHPGQLVTREGLKQKLWPADTFVDFDHSLNTAINKLREALGDSPNSPRFVETLPRRGYRFIYPVEGAPGEVPRPAAPITSLAVLPLANLSGDPAQDYFVDGMTDALITELAQISDLRVISRTSVMRFKDTKKGLPEIARELNVDAVVEGTVTRSANRVRISAQLVQAAIDRHLWARSYERDVRDVIALQGELARAVAHEVQAKLTPRARAGPAARRAAVDPEAYDLNLKARFLESQWANHENIQKAVRYYEQAIAKEPTYAAAHAGLALAHLSLAAALVEAVPPLEVIPKARAAVRKALEADEATVEAYAALGWITAFHDWEWEAGERAFRRAMELNPGHATAHMHMGHLLNTVGRHQETLALMRTARELDPLSPHILWSLPQGYLHVGALEQAVAECQKGIDLFPEFWPLHTLLGHIYLWQGRPDLALSTLERGAERSKRHPHALAILGCGLALSGRRPEAVKIAAEMSELLQQRYFSPAEMAWVYASLGEAEQALAWLEKAYRERSGWMTRLRLMGPVLGNLPSDPRFQDLLRRVNFPP